MGYNLSCGGMYISLQFKLQLKVDDKKKLLQLMRKQLSAIRSAYNMLKDKMSQNQIYENLRKLFSDLPTKYIDPAIYKAKQHPTYKKVVFGEKTLFEKLCKNHLQGKQRKRLKQEWKERKKTRNPKQVKSAWQVLKVALLFPVLGRSFARDLSPLKLLLVQGKWNRRRSKLVPLFAGGRPDEGF